MHLGDQWQDILCDTQQYKANAGRAKEVLKRSIDTAVARLAERCHHKGNMCDPTPIAKARPPDACSI
eukprot:1041915-Amphidinium_carterae.1